MNEPMSQASLTASLAWLAFVYRKIKVVLPKAGNPTMKQTAAITGFLSAGLLRGIQAFIQGIDI